MSIPDYYQVKWTDRGITMYGICDKYSEEAQEHYAATGRVLINDAILPVKHSVALADLTEIKCTFENNEYYDFIDAEYQKAQEFSDNLPDGVVKGKLFKTPRGDGYAWYMVTKVNKKTAHIEWRGYSADRWFDLVLGAGGKFDIDIIAAMVRPVDGLRAIFKKQEERRESVRTG